MSSVAILEVHRIDSDGLETEVEAFSSTYLANKRACSLIAEYLNDPESIVTAILDDSSELSQVDTRRETTAIVEAIIEKIKSGANGDESELNWARHLWNSLADMKLNHLCKAIYGLYYPKLFIFEEEVSDSDTVIPQISTSLIKGK